MVRRKASNKPSLQHERCALERLLVLRGTSLHIAPQAVPYLSREIACGGPARRTPAYHQRLISQVFSSFVNNEIYSE